MQFYVIQLIIRKKHPKSSNKKCNGFVSISCNELIKVRISSDRAIYVHIVFRIYCKITVFPEYMRILIKGG